MSVKPGQIYRVRDADAINIRLDSEGSVLRTTGDKIFVVSVQRYQSGVRAIDCTTGCVFTCNETWLDFFILAVDS